jgi:hypothetical protein
MADSATLTQRYFHPYERMRQIVADVASKAAGQASSPRVLEIGPGGDPFPAATEFVDWQVWPSLAGRTVHTLDINQDPLPIDDKSIDFAYCRHTLEDLYNPVWVCREMNRVARGGYIETPSPMAELVRGVEPNNPPWRGYIHHRYFVWDDDGVLTFLAKPPMLEHLEFTGEGELIKLLNAGPLHWNTYFFWEGELRFRMLQHDQDFKLQSNLAQVLERGVQRCVQSNNALAARFQLKGEGA